MFKKERRSCMAKKYNFLLAAQDYFQIRDEFEEFSALKRSAFVVFNKGFDVKQLTSKLEPWLALCEWNYDIEDRSYKITDINFSRVRSIFEDLSHGRIKRKQFYDDLAGVREILNNHEGTLSAAKDTKYKELISLYNVQAETDKILGFIFKEPQVQAWIMKLLQS